MANTIQIIIKARDQATQEMDRVSAASGKLKKHLEPVGSAMKLVGAGALAAGVASVKMAGDYEQGLNIFKSVSGATAQQMAMVAAKARELGQDASLPGVSARDAANAMTELSKAGLSVNDTLAASKGVMSLAKAGQIDVADAATVAAQALNAFKLKGSDATRVADVLANGANASATDIRGLSLGLQQSSAVASQFGISLEDTVTVLGLFANRGMQGSDAGTSLKTMLIALASPSKNAAKAMQSLGVNAYDAQGKFVGLRQFAINLQKGLSGLTEKQKQATLATIFGTDAFRAAAFLADSAGGKYDEMARAVGRSGAAMELAKAQNSGFNGALDNLKSTLETVATDVGMKLLPPLTKMIKQLADSGVIEAFGNILQALVPWIGMVASAFVALKIGTVIQWFVNLGKEVMKAGSFVKALGVLIKGNPIGFWLSVIAAVVTALITLENEFHIFSNAINWVKEAWGSMTKWFGDLFTAIGNKAKQIWSDISKVFTDVWNGITQTLTSIWSTIVDVFNNVVNFLREWGPTILAVIFWPFSLAIGLIITFKDQIMAVLTGLWNGIVTGFNFVADIVKGVLTVLAGVILGIWYGIEAGANVVIQGISSAVQAGVGFVQAVWAPVPGFFAGIWNGIQNVFRPVGQFFSGVFQWAASGANSALNTIVGVASGVYNAVVGFFRPIGIVAGNMIGGTIRGVVNGIIDLVQGGLNHFINMINGAAGIINKIPGVHIPGIPHIGLPRLAFGAKNYAGGVTLVGERGPELVNLPKGADVYTATQTANAFRNSRGGGGGVTIQHMEVHNDVDAHNVIEQIGWRLARG